MPEYIFQHPFVNVIRQLANEMNVKFTAIPIRDIWSIEGHHSRRTLTSVNIGLTKLKLTNEERYALVSSIFNREMASTKDMTISEAQALRMAMLGEGFVIYDEFLEIVKEWRQYND